MIVLPRFPRPNRPVIEMTDPGVEQRGASTLYVERPGSRHRVQFSWPREVMTPDVAAKFLSRLKRGKRQGVQIDMLLPQSQGSPGSPVVNGAGQSGTAIAVRGLTPGYVAKEDYWITLVEADGTAYLHSIVEFARASATGTATFQIEPPLRAPFPDGAAVHLARPFIQGRLLGETLSYAHEEQKRVPLTIAIEEFK